MVDPCEPPIPVADAAPVTPPISGAPRHRDADGAWMSDLRATRVIAILRPDRQWSPSERPEVTLRGAFGSAVYDVVCVHRAERERTGACTGCPRFDHCLVPSWFDPRGQDARSWVIQVDPHGPVDPETPLRVGLTLFGPIPRTSALIEALVRMAAAGLGERRQPHEVARLWVHGEGAPAVVVDHDRTVGDWPAPTSLARLVQMPAESVSGARVRLVTPFQQKGGSRPTPEDVLKAAILRVRAVARAQGVQVSRRWPDPPEGRWLELERVVASRRPSSQAGSHDLSGWVGELELDGAVGPFVDLLGAAEVLHVGRGSSAGLGRVRVHWCV